MQAEVHNVTVLHSDSLGSEAKEIAASLERGVPGLASISCRLMPLSQLDEAIAGPCSCLLMLPDDHATTERINAMVRACMRTNTPAVLVAGNRPDDPGTCDGVLRVEPGTSGQALAGIVSGLATKRSDQQLEQSLRATQDLKRQLDEIHDEIQMAASVQQDFLPNAFPRMHGVEFASMWRPASSVSGDIFDFIKLDDEHVGIFLADAIGHGIPAALLTMVICRSLPAIESINGQPRIVPPAEAMERLNRNLMRRYGRTTRFATALYGVINCRTRRISIACAGHPPPLLLSPGRSMQTIQINGGLLGVFEGERYQQHEFTIQGNQRLLLYSDGFEQAFPSPDAAKKGLPNKRYLEEFQGLHDCLDAATLVRRINRGIENEQGHDAPRDDMTLLCVGAGAQASTRRMLDSTTTLKLRSA